MPFHAERQPRSKRSPTSMHEGRAGDSAQHNEFSRIRVAIFFTAARLRRICARFLICTDINMQPAPVGLQFSERFSAATAHAAGSRA
jgi:hypothetical protein